MSGGGDSLESANALDVLRTDPDWSGCYDRVIAALEGKTAPADDPGEVVSGAKQTVVERYARAISGDVSLALTLPMALVSAAVCGQGAFWLKAPLENGGELAVPGIMQFTGIAPSGYGKSTALEPMIEIVDRLNRMNTSVRRGMVAGEASEILAKIKHDNPKDDNSLWDEAADTKVVLEICENGVGTQLTTDSGTSEGVRTTLQMNGGVTGIMTAEPDVLQEISRYSKDGGTFRYLLDGWSGAKVQAARAGGGIHIPRVVVPYCIVVQPMTFEQFNETQTRAQGAGGGGMSTDTAIGRGLYGRSWLVRVNARGGVGKAFGLKGFAGVGAGQLVGIPAAAAKLEDVLAAQLARSNRYRAEMGICIGWETMAADKKRTNIAMKAPDLPERVWLTLTDEALAEYAMVQNIRESLPSWVEQAEIRDKGSADLFGPMTSRWTQHVLRIALLLTLAANPDAKVVPAWAVRDAGLRLVPWLLEHWCLEMTAYHARVTVESMEEQTKANKTGIDLTWEGRMIEAIGSLMKNMKQEDCIAQGLAVKKAKSGYSSRVRNNFTNQLNTAFVGLVSKGYLEEVVQPADPDKPKSRPRPMYRRTSRGMAMGLSGFGG
jgi:hypothetical protein